MHAPAAVEVTPDVVGDERRNGREEDEHAPERAVEGVPRGQFLLLGERLARIDGPLPLAPQPLGKVLLDEVLERGRRPVELELAVPPLAQLDDLLEPPKELMVLVG